MSRKEPFTAVLDLASLASKDAVLRQLTMQCKVFS